MSKSKILRVLYTVALFVVTLSSGLSAQDTPVYTGEGNGSSRDAAILAARTNAINKAMEQERKDPLFVDILLTQWPGAIRTESETVDRGLLPNTWTAKISISLGAQDVFLATNAWSAQATQILDQAATLLASARERESEASAAETNGDLSQAWVAWTQARRNVEEALEVMKLVRSALVLSTQGLNPEALRTQATALGNTIKTAMAELEAIQRRVGEGDETKLIRDSISTMRDRANDIALRLRPLAEKAPYFDLAEGEIEGILTSLRGLKAELDTTREKLLEAQALLLPDQAFFKTQMRIIQGDLDIIDDRLALYIRQARAESQDPRVGRQARAEAAMRRNAAIASLVSSVLWHEDGRTLKINLPLPFILGSPGDLSTPPVGTLASIELQRAFPVMWVKTGTYLEGYTISPDYTQLGLSQGVDFGFGKSLMLGGGFSWDWLRTGDVLDQKTARIHLGSVDQGETYPWALLTLAWNFPAGGTAFMAEQVLNGTLTGYLSLEGVVDIKGGLYRRYLQTKSIEGLDADAIPGAFALVSGMYAGVELRIGPWVPGVLYRLDWQGPLRDGSLEELHRGWQLSLGYGW